MNTRECDSRGSECEYRLKSRETSEVSRGQRKTVYVGQGALRSPVHPYHIRSVRLSIRKMHRNPKSPSSIPAFVPSATKPPSRRPIPAFLPTSATKPSPHMTTQSLSFPPFPPPPPPLPLPLSLKLSSRFSTLPGPPDTGALERNRCAARLSPSSAARL